MEQCPFCRDSERFVQLLDDMQAAIIKNERKISLVASEVHGMCKVETHMHYLTAELAEFKADRKHFYAVAKSLVSYVKKTGILP